MELRCAYDFYDSQRPGLGDDFINEIEAVFDLILAHSGRNAIVMADVRRRTVRRFPYQIFYRTLTDGVKILAVFHTVRDPSTWQRRMG